METFLFPLTSAEVPDLDLSHALNTGLLPVHYLATNARPRLKAYINSYIKEEIIDEAVTRNVPAFSRFLQAVGLTHGRLVNYANLARECGVSANTVRLYYQILIDTLLGFELPPWRKTKTRRLIETAKFYVFDIGVANYLTAEVDLIVGQLDLAIECKAAMRVRAEDLKGLRALLAEHPVKRAVGPRERCKRIRELA